MGSVAGIIVYIPIIIYFTLIIDEVKTVDIVNISIAIIIDSLLTIFLYLIHPHIRDKVRMSIVNTLIDHCYNY